MFPSPLSSLAMDPISDESEDWGVALVASRCSLEVPVCEENALADWTLALGQPPASSERGADAPSDGGDSLEDWVAVAGVVRRAGVSGGVGGPARQVRYPLDTRPRCRGMGAAAEDATAWGLRRKSCCCTSSCHQPRECSYSRPSHWCTKLGGRRIANTGALYVMP